MKNKEFDCVKMKYQVQEKLSKKFETKNLNEYVSKMQKNIKFSALFQKISHKKRELVNN